ncbi:hypothetical protein [Aeromonas phage Akh-2]|nr:hypothetical protein [Aeromonas phage Akh-2]
MFSILAPRLVRKYIRTSDNSMREEYVPVSHVPNFTKSLTSTFKLEDGAPVPFLLKAESGDLRKRFYYEVVHQENPDSIKSAVKFLKKPHNNPELLMVVGQKKVGQETLVPRTKVAFDSHNAKFKLIAFDIDSWVDMSAPNPTDLEAVGKYIVSLLHSEFPTFFPETMGHIVLASSSAGISSGIRAHFYFINEQELTGGQVRFLIDQINGKLPGLLDNTTYSPARILITAPPVLNGLADPFSDKPRLYYTFGCSTTIPESIEAALEATEYEELNKNHLEILAKLEGVPVVGNPNINTAIAQLPMNLQRKCLSIVDGKVTDNMYIKTVHTLYFDALQEGIDIQDFERNILTPMLRDYANRHGSAKKVKDYLHNGFRFAVARSIADVARNVSFPKENKWKHQIHDCEPSPHGKLVLPKSFPEKGKLSFLKASLGMGKTYSVRELQKAGKLGAILAVTNRVTLVESIASAMDLDIYTQTGFEVNPKGIATTIHSLYRVSERFMGIKGTKTLFIDESDSTIQELLDSAIIDAEKRDRILNALYSLLLQCDYVILADGDTSSETVEAYSTLIGNTKPTITYQSEVPTHLSSKVFEHKTEADIIGHLLTNATSGLPMRILVVTDYGPKQIDELSYGISQHCQTMGVRQPNIVEIHAESKEDDDVRAIMDAPVPTKALVELSVDICITSPSMTSGVDFQRYFTHVYCITSSGLNSPAIRIQAICRERHPIYVHYWTSGDANGGIATPAKCLSSFDKGMIGDLQTLFFLRKMREHNKYQFYIRYNMLKKSSKITILPPCEENLLEYKALAMYSEEHLNLYATKIYMSKNCTSTKRINNAKLIYKAVQHFSGIEDITIEHIVDFLEDNTLKKAEKAYRFMSVPGLWDELCQIMDAQLEAGWKKTKFVDLCLVNLPKLYRAGVSYNNKVPTLLFSTLGIGMDKFWNWEPATAISNVEKYCSFNGLALPTCLKEESIVDYSEMLEL